jgi:DNA-binding transcriptional LysR family regulator
MADVNAERFIRDHIKTRHLVLLVEMGRHRSILHAAKAANLTQPAASKQLAELEGALGVQLFDRLPRGVAPTRFGEVLIRRASAALAELQAAHREVTDLLAGLSGKVTVGTVLTPAVGMLPDAINRLKSRYARLQVSVVVDCSDRLIERLCCGELDIAIGHITDSHSAAELNFEPLTEESYSAVVGSGHPLAGRGDVRIEELAHLCWIVPPASNIVRDRLMSMFLSHGLNEPMEIVEASELPMITRLLASSDMVAALPEEAVRLNLDTGTLTRLSCQLQLRVGEYGIVTRKKHELSPGARALLSILRESPAGPDVAAEPLPVDGQRLYSVL